ncbi:MAG: DUF6116 family protein [Stenotrophomonas indicatrix]|jgi:hypothetical protein|uniref:Transmembrane protein n=1 Tax=Stenotrophomonas indicatrix TaxID=2045451 RepID=A0A1W1GTW3_9GAMM|nr:MULTISPECIES: DUF6116 family protein [Stenotrophomonas]PJL07602.1 hypothetical protein B9Y68_11985 [Stenotrophomonas maltophilia]MBO1749629.1 hypothetical protein [Stenotrophomonas indicatrix]MCR8716209.1 hypothetical protein [Stenotrophomonas indicatrix]MDH6329642.1 lauroyl/myristoyl acyltransferase [Stenotrophomonas sp. 1278]MDN8661231.1 hypothetical protein [Stenotrophomonas indicatrix]
MANPMLLPVLQWARRLRYPTLFKLTAGLFALTLFIPDPIPFVDELMLGLGTLLLANWKNRSATTPPPLEQR